MVGWGENMGVVIVVVWRNDYGCGDSSGVGGGKRIGVVIVVML